MTTTAEILRKLPYFSDLPEDLIERVCEASTQSHIDEGTVIIEEGSDSSEMYVLAEGHLVVTKHSGAREVELARLGPGEVVGEIALLDQSPRTATVTAAEDSLVITIPVSAFEDLLSDPRVVRRMFRTVTSRLRGIENTLRHEERMAALGRMAAQLMHELNNPAAAVSRSTQELSRLYEDLGAEAEVLTSALVGASDLARPPAPEPMSALERSEAEDLVADWLEDHDVPDPWELAPALVDGGWTVDYLDKAIDQFSPELASRYARWIALRAAAEQVLSEVSIGARRISELVRIVKEFSYLDQAPVQDVLVIDGIRDTLVLLKHKLRDLEVSTDFAEDLPRVEAPGRDLNQVWTNLIDNAAHAMEGGGTLTISAHPESDDVVVRISDTGTGIPQAIVDQIFDPFFTTKEPGEGTGLGLHTVHTIVGRVGGDISVESGPEGTTFTVRLPSVPDQTSPGE